MKRRVQLALFTALILLIAMAVGAAAWDSSRSEQIADGVRVGEIELGGLDGVEAAGRLERELVAPLRKPVRVVFRDQTFTLAAEKLEVGADIEAMVDKAQAASRHGGLPTRVIRDLTGGEVERTIEPRTAYSNSAVERFVGQIAADVNREARDANIDPTPRSLTPVSARDGLRLREGRLMDDIEEMLADRSGTRTIEARAEQIEPQVTTEELAEQYPAYVTVDRDNFRLRVFKDLELAESYKIAIGQLGYDTPAGVYAVESKQVNPTWYVPNSDWAGKLAGKVIPPGPDNPLKARWMGFFGASGIHGTAEEDSIGTAASRGCIRMRIPDVIEVYDRISVGTPVYVQ